MSRAAIFDAIVSDSTLQGMGFRAESAPGAKDATVLANYDGYQRPSDKLFMILTWGNEDEQFLFQRTFKNLTIWVHCYREFSTDFTTYIAKPINRLKDLLTAMVHVDGADGDTLTCVEETSRSKDMRDDSYQTICRSVSYRVLSRETESV